MRHSKEEAEFIKKTESLKDGLRFERFLYERELEYEEWARKLPYIKWPSHWHIKAIPAFNGLMVRYNIKLEPLIEAHWASVYLDCWNFSGFMSWPYWEVYPVDGDVGRCKWDDIQGEHGLLNLIGRALGEIKDEAETY